MWGCIGLSFWDLYTPSTECGNPVNGGYTVGACEFWGYKLGFRPQVWGIRTQDRRVLSSGIGVNSEALRFQVL